MAMSCGMLTNGGHKITGALLPCGTHLYWKIDNTRPQDRTLEVLLCDKCKGESQ